LIFGILELMSDSSEYLVLSVNRTKNPELGDVSIRRMEGLVRGSLMPDPRPGGPLTMVDRQRDLRPCYMQNGSFLVAGASAKDNEDRDQSSTVPATGWDSTGVPGQEPVECGRESQTVSPRRHIPQKQELRIIKSGNGKDVGRTSNPKATM